MKTQVTDILSVRVTLVHLVTSTFIVKCTVQNASTSASGTLFVCYWSFGPLNFVRTTLHSSLAVSTL